MANISSIILPSGIGAIPPTTNNRIPKWVIGGASPSLTDSIMGEVPGPPIAIVIGTDPNPAATEKLRLSGGAMIEGVNGAGVVQADSVSIGRGAVVVGAMIVIGRLASAAGSSGLAIGNLALATGNFNYAIGTSAQATGTSNSIAFGPAALASNLDCIAIGGGARAIGPRCTVVGVSSSGVNQATNFDSCVFGAGAANTGTGFSVCGFGGNHGTAPNASAQLALGNSTPWLGAKTVSFGGPNVNTEFTTLVFGNGDTNGTSNLITWRFTNRSGTNVAAQNAQLVAPRGTGLGASARLVLQAGIVGVAGAVQHVVGDAFAVDGNAVATETRALIFDVDTGLLSRISVGAAGSGGVGFKVLRIPN